MKRVSVDYIYMRSKSPLVGVHGFPTTGFAVAWLDRTLHFDSARKVYLLRNLHNIIKPFDDKSFILDRLSLVKPYFSWVGFSSLSIHFAVCTCFARNSI